jgi:hypothetical protein
MGSRTVVDRPLTVVDAVNTVAPVTYWVSVDHLNRPVKTKYSATGEGLPLQSDAIAFRRMA